ncbi:MAG: hypothetical protein FWG00_05565 [Coriobacteriia bacterium]|nr:hypothetical protein [Coriobacteriia bacterium]
MKKAIIIVIAVCLLLSFVCCDNVRKPFIDIHRFLWYPADERFTDPFCLQLNENFYVLLLYDREAEKKYPTLIKETFDEEGYAEHYEHIIAKNFVAFDVKNDILVLCEELEDKTQVFWSFNLETEELLEHKTYKDLCADLGIEGFDWEPLWAGNFELIEN